jgi:hypothetical protein
MSRKRRKNDRYIGKGVPEDVHTSGSLHPKTVVTTDEIII